MHIRNFLQRIQDCLFANLITEILFGLVFHQLRLVRQTFRIIQNEDSSRRKVKQLLDSSFIFGDTDLEKNFSKIFRNFKKVFVVCIMWARLQSWIIGKLISDLFRSCRAFLDKDKTKYYYFCTRKRSYLRLIFSKNVCLHIHTQVILQFLLNTKQM